MKRIITLMSFCLFAGMVFGQSPAMKVASSGNVGIGQADPNQKLDVNGNILIPNGNYYLARNVGGGLQQAFGMDGNDDIIFNRSALTAQKTSGLIFGTANKFIDFRDQNNSVMMRLRASDGFLGIGTNAPSHELTLAVGEAAKPGGGEWEATSDKRSKKSINSFTLGLKEILEIKPVRYQYNGKFGTKDDGKEYIGVVAQEFQKVAPYSVSKRLFQEVTSSYTNGKERPEKVNSTEEYLSVDASSIKYMLVNAIQEQQEIISSQSDRIEKLEDLVESLIALDVNNKEIELNNALTGYISQNAPNPFNGSTTIKYTVPQAAKTASINIYDMSGTLLRKEIISNYGNGTLTVNAGSIPSGTYTYNLIVDGKVMGTNKMILQN